MSGVEVAQAIRKAKSSVYVVGCTGNALREDQEQYLEAGADYILPKPVHRGAIEERLEEATRRKRYRMANADVVEQDFEARREEDKHET
jgi:DNA-binding response OmpR family regulator